MIRFALRPLTASVALAAMVAMPAGAAPQSASDFQWTFDAACLHSQPALIERGAAQLAENLGLSQMEASDVDAFWLGDNGLSVIVDGNPLATTCTVIVPWDEITDDAATLTEVIGARIAARARDSDVAVTSEEGVTRWEWTRSDVGFVSELESRDGSYTLTLTASRGM